MKIKDLDKKIVEEYCNAHWCSKCPLYDLSEKLSIDCYKIPNFIENLKQIDSHTEISILTKEEWLYLKAVIEPFEYRVQNIKIVNGFICIRIRPELCCKIIKCFEFKGLIEYKDYTLEELDL